ncbi:hypothetical protein NNJEOMEG_03159 [Fundidesulfovibrio magnetotacticus]|uniref:Uncharacterized protein n=1 Tax=Fundidesulfovibrio magnetotacticus TaxID=2730080 RepID=A0A6V8LWN0_9BACT|nr:hypothetical protein [Fundidesulfovibrio magnetotacticus]GFK95300.1 hypothetical protein NNJEOMEG_03159 [Fundidesulfovibrio magnetotacticus]
MRNMHQSKWVRFGLAGGAGGLLAGMAYHLLEPRGAALTWIVGVCLVCVMAAGAIVWAQHRYQGRAGLPWGPLARCAAVTLPGGALAGFIAYHSGFFTSGVLGLGSDYGRFFGWVIAGALAGWAVAASVPNLKRGHAALGGAAGGLAGCSVMYLLGHSLVAGLAVQGLAIGVCVALVEVVFRKAWLEYEALPVSEGVTLRKRVRRVVALGDKPIVFGAGRAVDIVLADGMGYPEEAARLEVRGARIVLEDRINRLSRDLQNGSRGQVGNVEYLVRESLPTASAP